MRESPGNLVLELKRDSQIRKKYYKYDTFCAHYPFILNIIRILNKLRIMLKDNERL